MRIKSFIAVVSLIIGFVGVVSETPALGAEADVHAALQRWVETLGSGKGEAPILALYAPDAILLSTFDAKPLETPAEIAAYFQKLTQNPTSRLKSRPKRSTPSPMAEQIAGFIPSVTPRMGRKCGCRLALTSCFAKLPQAG